MSSVSENSVETDYNKECIYCFKKNYEKIGFVTLNCQHILCVSCINKKNISLDNKIFSCNYCNKNKSNTKSLRDLDLDFINYRQYKSLYNSDNKNYSQFI